MDQFAFEFHCVALVCDGCLSLLILSGSATFGLDIFMQLPIIQFFSLFLNLLINPVEFEFADHDDGVGVFELLEKRSVLLDGGDDEVFGFGRDHVKDYKDKLNNLHLNSYKRRSSLKLAHLNKGVWNIIMLGID